MPQKYHWSVFAEQHLMNNKGIHVVGRGKILLAVQQTYLSWFCSLKEMREYSKKVGTWDSLLKHHSGAGNTTELLWKISKKVRIQGHCVSLVFKQDFSFGMQLKLKVEFGLWQENVKQLLSYPSNPVQQGGKYLWWLNILWGGETERHLTEK